jgi:HSP20 family protein
MRYRRLTYRYALVLPTRAPRPIGDAWPGDRPGVTLAQPRWCPPADIYETATAVAVTVELAGIEQDDLDVLLFEDAVIVEGERRLPPADERGVYHAAEIRQGQFRCEILLPAPIDAERVEARYERGLLQMTFAKQTTGGHHDG